MTSIAELQLLSSLLDEVLDLTVGERLSWLEVRPGIPDDLRPRLQALLAKDSTRFTLPPLPCYDQWVWADDSEGDREGDDKDGSPGIGRPGSRWSEG